MKLLKAIAILVAGFLALLIVVGMLVPEEYAERAREERRQAATSAPTEPSGSAASSSADTSSQPAPRSNLTSAQRNAVRSAESYLVMKGFSRQGLIDQLSSEYGEKFEVRDATVAVDSLSADWNTQAARSAESYLKMKGFSCRGLIDQLSSQYGEKFTVEQATFGATRAGIC
jgi:hypothetical protein